MADFLSLPSTPRRPAAERPNTIAGLVAKRRELEAVRASLEADLRKVVCDLDHLDGAIRLFEPEAAPAAVHRYAAKHRGGEGKLQRFVLERLHEAREPATSKGLPEARTAARGLRADDATFVVLRNRVGACLITLRARGIVRNAPWRDGYAGYGMDLGR